MVFLTFLESRSNEAIRYLGIVYSIIFQIILGFSPSNSVFKSLLNKIISTARSVYARIMSRRLRLKILALIIFFILDY